MSKTQHTPGPWFTDDVQRGDLFRYVICGDGDTFQYLCRTSTNGNPNAEADARLIAAAPELLAALRALLAHPDGGTYRNSKNSPDVKAAHAAIAKATTPNELR